MRLTTGGAKGIRTAITGPDGHEMLDRWAKALQMKEEVAQRWARVCGETA